MKKQYFFIWMMAATMFAASCSKDGSDEKVDTQTPAEVSQDVQTKKTHPITIVAEKKSSSVSKVHLVENSKSDLVFDDGDVLVLMNGEDKCGELTLKSGAGESSATFEGTIDDEVTSFTAQIGTELQSVATSNESLKALVDEYTFLKSGEVTYTEGETISISLTDQNAYFAIATNLDNTKIKIGTADEQEISANGIWLAVPDGTSVTLFGKTVTAAKGQFYSVAKDNLLTSITLSDATATIAVGGTKTLTVSAYAPNTASNAVAWSSSDTEVARVDANGVVTGVAVGTATITATATDGSGETATCTVTVESAVPAGYVDLDVVLEDGTKVYFSSTVTSTGVAWSDKTDEDRADWPTLDDFENLVSDCYWRWDNTQGHNGYYVFKTHDEADKGQITNSSSSYSPSASYSIDNDPYIFLPVSDDGNGRYWSGESSNTIPDIAFGLYFNEKKVTPHDFFQKSSDLPGVVTVRRSN